MESLPGKNQERHYLKEKSFHQSNLNLLTIQKPIALTSEVLLKESMDIGTFLNASHLITFNKFSNLEIIQSPKIKLSMSIAEVVPEEQQHSVFSKIMDSRM